MFKGKVYVYKNINGKEEKIEREFDNSQDFQSFVQNNEVSGLESFSDTPRSPILGLGDWANLQNYFDNLIDRRLGLIYDGYDEEQDNYAGGNLIDLNKYESELKKIDYQKQHKDETLKHLKSTLQKLKDYKKKFKNEGREDMIESIDLDIKKIENEISKFDK
ncbi:MAG TPA: hypothetical protein PK674_01060 [Candidatus Absconditabacterales bacterium]|nr:hypothetical protein [Candidatus Absconditabacterales bacterium]HOQ78815.1 hypothetical protein [Candidatus Absconditabacterales bacterium]HPK27935.1 hypothetical protein [Candidatus Absconditabacterales bacterium]